MKQAPSPAPDFSQQRVVEQKIGRDSSPIFEHSNLLLKTSVFSTENNLVTADKKIIENSNMTSSAINNEIDRFAELLANLIEKYAEQIDLDSLPCPPRPADE